jgi:hypothetical protein
MMITFVVTRNGEIDIYITSPMREFYDGRYDDWAHVFMVLNEVMSYSLWKVTISSEYQSYLAFVKGEASINSNVDY